MSADTAHSKGIDWLGQVAIQRDWPDAVTAHVEAILQQALPSTADDWGDVLLTGSPIAVVDALYVSDEEEAQAEHDYWIRVADLLLNSPPPGGKPPAGYDSFYLLACTAANQATGEAERAWVNSPLGKLAGWTEKSAQDLRSLPEKAAEAAPKIGKGTLAIVVLVIGLAIVLPKLMRGGL